MTDRTSELRALAEDVAAREGVLDAWTAKSFTDRLFVVEVPPDSDLPEGLRSELAAHHLEGANEAFDIPGVDAFMGRAGGSDRYRFVDTRARGDLQSYVVE